MFLFKDTQRNKRLQQMKKKSGNSWRSISELIKILKSFISCVSGCNKQCVIWQKSKIGVSLKNRKQSDKMKIRGCGCRESRSSNQKLVLTRPLPPSPHTDLTLFILSILKAEHWAQDRLCTVCVKCVNSSSVTHRCCIWSGTRRGVRVYFGNLWK